MISLYYVILSCWAYFLSYRCFASLGLFLCCWARGATETSGLAFYTNTIFFRMCARQKIYTISLNNVKTLPIWRALSVNAVAHALHCNIFINSIHLLQISKSTNLSIVSSSTHLSQFNIGAFLAQMDEGAGGMQRGLGDGRELKERVLGMDWVSLGRL